MKSPNDRFMPGFSLTALALLLGLGLSLNQQSVANDALPDLSAPAAKVPVYKNKTVFYTSAAVANALLLADYLQTKDIVARPTEFHETNPILGQHPSGGKVDVYFAAAALLTNALAIKLDDSRVYFVVGAAEGITVAHNLSLGLHFNY